MFSIAEKLEMNLAVPLQELWMDALLHPKLPQSYQREIQYTDKYHGEKPNYPLATMGMPAIHVDDVSSYAERACAGMMETTSPLYHPTALYMPAVRAQDSYLQEAINDIAKSVKEEDTLGVARTNEGEIPFVVYSESNPLGVTGFDEDGNPVMMGVSSSVLRSHDKFTRVMQHEMNHADSAALVRYVDVPDYIARAIIEGYAEYRTMWNHPEMARQILSDTPYGNEIAIAREIEHSYISEGGMHGYRAFMEDIMKHESMAYALRQLERSINDLQVKMNDDKN